MRILLTNDDGIYSPGLWSVAQALKRLGEVFIVAPDRDQSGIGTAMSLKSVVRVHEFPSHLEGVDALAVEGTPTDCVILATETLFDEPFDLVVSGINRGANLGLDVISSGTVGAAINGYLRGINSIAVSVTSLIDVRFETASHVASLFASFVLNERFGAKILLNVNVPNLMSHKIEGIEFVSLGPRAYLANVERTGVGRRAHYWITHSGPSRDTVSEGTDVWAIENNRVAVTALEPEYKSKSLRGKHLRPVLEEIDKMFSSR